MSQWEDHPSIWLTPCCEKCVHQLKSASVEDGILWCEDPQDPCAECGKPWVKYVLSSKQKEAPDHDEASHSESKA